MDEILNLIESVSEGFPSYFYRIIKTISWDRNLLYKLTAICCMVGLRTGFLQFNTPFSFSLHISSKTLSICFESTKAGVKSYFLTVLVEHVSIL